FSSRRRHTRFSRDWSSDVCSSDLPRGGEYKVVLPDGTIVWLNADSRLSYPTVFNGQKRVVSLQGEAYFDVSHDAKHPFVVIHDRSEERRVGKECRTRWSAKE